MSEAFFPLHTLRQIYFHYLSHCHLLSSCHRWQPQASRFHHSAWTLQQLCAIREEPTAAILINIDLVSTYPSGSVQNSRYCISTLTANISLGQYWRAAVASLTLAVHSCRKNTRSWNRPEERKELLRKILN